MVDGPTSPQLGSVPGDTSKVLANFAAALAGVSTAAKASNLQVVFMTKATTDLEKKEREAARATRYLADHIAELTDDSEKLSKGLQALSDRYAKSMDVMSEAQAAALEKEIENIKAAQKAAMGEDKQKRNAAIFSERSAQLQSLKLKDNLNQQVLHGKMLQRSGNVMNMMGGAMESVWGKAKLAKAGMVDAAGSLFGLTAETMELLSGAAAIFGAIFAVFAAGMKNIAQYAGEAAKAGMRVPSRDAAAGVSQQYQGALFKAASPFGFSIDQVSKFAGVFNNELGRSIDGNIENTTLLATKLAGAGLAMGMTSEDAVKLGAKLGVLSRGSIEQTEMMFQQTGDQAAKLGFSMGVMADPMSQLAEMAGRVGGNVNTATIALEQITDTAIKLKNTGGVYSKLFSSMKGADQLKMVTSFTTMLTKMSDIDLLAFSMKPGEGLFSGLQRLTKEGTSAQGNALKSLMGTIDYKGMEQQEKGSGNYLLSQILGNGGFEGRQAIIFGQMVAEMTKSKKPVSFEELRTKTLVKGFGESATAGEYIGGGGDPLHWIGNGIDQLVKYASSIAGSLVQMTGLLHLIPGVGGSKYTMPQTYGSGAMAAGRQAKPSAGAAHLFP